MKKFTLLVAVLAISLVTFAQGKITYELNGGVTNNYGWANKQDMYEHLNAIWNNFKDTAIVWTPLDSLADFTKGIPTQASNMDLTILEDSAFKADFGWLITYLDYQCTEQEKTLPSSNATYLRYNLAAFFSNTVRASWPVSADYTLAGDISYFQRTWKAGFVNPEEYVAGDSVVLNAPYKDGFTFEGWYKAADFSGEKVTSVKGTGDVTLYANYVEYIPSIKEVIALEDSTATKVQGTVTYVAGTNFWIQDATAGILCYGKNDLKEGDFVTLSGEKVIYKGSPELANAKVEAKEEGKEYGAQTVLISALYADSLKNYKTYLNELVYIEGITISGYKGNYKDPYITDGFNEIALYKWEGITEDKYPVGTKISLKAVLGIYNKNIQLRGKEAWIKAAAVAAKDPYEEPEVEIGVAKYNLESNWMYSVNLNNWNDNRPNPMAEGSRSVVEKGGTLYFAYRNANTPTEKPKLVRVDAKTGKMLEPVIFADNIFKDVKGNWLFGPYTDLKLDNAGNAITSNLPTTGDPFQVWSVDLETGVGKLIIDLATDTNQWLKNQFPDSVYKAIRLDRIGVYGDINADATIMSVVPGSSTTIGKHALYWNIKNGKWDEKTNIIKLGFGAEGDNLGTAPVICPIEDDQFYVDGFSTYPMLFDPDGNLLDAFDESHEADALTIGAKDVARSAGHNGVTEFEVNGRYYLIIAGDNTVGNGTAPSTFVLYRFANEDREFKDMTQLWEFPMAGMGNISNPQRVATSFARPNEDGTAVDIYVFTAENGYGSYTMTIEGETPVENVELNFNIWVENSTIVADSEIEAIFTVTGQNVTMLNGNLSAGAYIVRTAEGVAKVMVK